MKISYRKNINFGLAFIFKMSLCVTWTKEFDTIEYQFQVSYMYTLDHNPTV